MSRKEDLVKINDEIISREVRLIGNNVEVGIYTRYEAIKIANEQGLDLIEVNSSVTPSICKIEEYSKYIYDLKKKKKEQDKKNKQNLTEVKELRFTPNTDEHDFNFKLNHAESFLKKGDKVKAFVFFKGREIVYSDKGQFLLLKLVDALSEFGQAESLPKLEGHKMSVVIKPKKAI